MSNHLTLQFIGASVMGLRAAGLAEQSRGTLFLEDLTQLKVTLFGVSVFLRRSERAESFAFSFQQHGELAADFIVLSQCESATITDDRVGLMVKMHLSTSCANTVCSIPVTPFLQTSLGGQKGQIKYVPI